jgi:transposase-like protein
MASLSKAHVHDEAAAFDFLEKTLWPDGAVCPHCGSIGKATRLQGKATRIGVWKCNEKECRKQFTVKVGTVFEHGRLPLHKFLQAVYLLCCSKKGCSSHQLHRILGITYKSAWFLSHRIREAMRTGALGPLGGSGKVVEVDETYYGNIPEADRAEFTTSGKPFSKNRGGPKHKRPIVALVERGGSVRSFYVPEGYLSDVMYIVRENIARESRLHTDESRLYMRVGKEFAAHETVKHSDEEYVRGDVTTNTVEGYFSIFKRGMKGVYQHCSEKHLHRYLAEFDFRYSQRVALGVNDEARTNHALKGVVGKRLTYRNPNVTAAG